MQLLSKSEVDRIMSSLTKEQQEFLLENIKQSKKSKWLEVLARNKGISIQQETTTEVLEQLIDDWVLVEIFDSGFGCKNYRCKCGMPLRYQYVIYNKKKGETIGLGIKCFEHYTNLPNEVVRDIIKEFHKLDLIRDEILQKVDSDYYFDITPYLYIKNLPPMIVEQANLQLPLTDNQIARLERIKKGYDFESLKVKVLQRLKPQGREFFETLPNKDKDELLNKMVNYEYFKVLPGGFHDDEIQQFLSMGLPLLDRQIEKTFHFYERIREERAFEERRKREELHQSFPEANSRPRRISTIDTTITYETLKVRHLETLKKVRRKENELSQGMKHDWDKVQLMFRQCKKGEVIDYSSFKVNLSMICISLRIQGDLYL